MKLDLNQGIDARLIDGDVARRIAQIKPLKPWRIAFDTLGCEKAVMGAIDLLRDAGLNVRTKLMCYVYVHDDTQFDDALYRCNRLREKGVLAYVMLNQDHQFGGMVKTLRRWTTPWIYYKCTFDEYLQSRGDKLY